MAALPHEAETLAADTVDREEARRVCEEMDAVAAKWPPDEPS
jgi:hypothetical protein